LKNKRTSRCRQARPINLSAAPLTTGSPEIGVPTLVQHHGLHAASLKTSSPVLKPLAEHNLESGDSTYIRPRNQRGAGRHPIFTEEQIVEYQSKFEEWLLLQPKQKRKRNRKVTIEYVRTIIGDIEVGDGTILSQIIRPVLKKLKIKK
jgi:hypothetical protein